MPKIMRCPEVGIEGGVLVAELSITVVVLDAIGGVLEAEKASTDSTTPTIPRRFNWPSGVLSGGAASAEPCHQPEVCGRGIAVMDRTSNAANRTLKTPECWNILHPFIIILLTNLPL
ncbi:MAG: hypothetical protein IIB17_04500 [Chloroflexi bacterium]|nr:hypothetical protein [Chloroflexota bacterium]